MKVVVFGGSGLIGKKLCGILRAKGHEVIPASPSTGVDILSGAGVAEALRGAEVVVDVVNSPSFEADAVMSFFQQAARVCLPAEVAAGVRHHVALSVVGAERLPTSGYMLAKVAQEAAIRAASVPYTIVRATQFFEFVSAIVDAGTKEGTVTLTPALLQPIAADDVAAALAAVVEESPRNGMVEIAGPEALGCDELGRRWIAAKKDARKVVTDAAAGYFGAQIDDQSLTPGTGARMGARRFEDWLARG
ncbi:SDR family oxidoreductase [Polyangium sorediatum]|uniref:SDR family oxidoreductase n=1 Tax=Polyangium sorediatum TaxID=889274 RepID=A0ABT6P7W4_9BACT|nr:SDR family oxidoreductase [Polyangium sorediatum]MDI1436687.1 SDR family oxidoreductase [Polyangium sorediatum]